MKVPIHHRFQFQKESNFQIISKLTKTVTKELFASYKQYNKIGPQHRDWPLNYQLTVTAMRIFMKECFNVKYPLIKFAQNHTKNGLYSPLQQQLESFEQEKDVIKFMAGLNNYTLTEQSEKIHKIDGEWLSKEAGKKIIFHLHGGGYIAGSAQACRHWTSHFVIESGYSLLGLNYRLSPQHPFPCSIIDAVSVYKHLLDTGSKAEDVVFMGDSAGGNLVISSLQVIRDMGLDMPKGAVLISPWCDISCTSDSIKDEHMQSIDYLPRSPKDSRLEDRISYYCANEDLQKDYISPLYSKNLIDLCPMLIQYGSVEGLRDEIRGFYKNAIDQGLENVEIQEFHGHVHDFHIFRFAKGSEEAVNIASEWILKLDKEPPVVSKSVKYDFNGKKIGKQ
jgi:acetyl esterase/lipase